MSSQLYLASQSPRRRELLHQIGIDYQVLPVTVDETPGEGEVAAEYVIRMALAKARAGRAAIDSCPALPVLGADTAVVVDREILGKPKDQNGFLEMMRALSGRVHKVLTGVALDSGTVESRLSVSTVRFRAVTEAEALRYWASGEPADKAGGYAVQGMGAMFISRLEGSYSGVMGLPLFETAELLCNGGFDLFSDIKI